MSSATPAPRILVVCGSARKEVRLLTMLDRVSASARDAGAELRELNLSESVLPVMSYGDETQGQIDAVKRTRELANWADAFVLGTPEYHGSMSGALKNWFDYLYSELAGKVAVVAATTGGGTGDLSITAVKTSFSWCHGFPLPFHCAATSADFDGAELNSSKITERLDRMGRDLVHYTPVLRSAFQTAQSLGKGIEAGFAGLHTQSKN